MLIFVLLTTMFTANDLKQKCASEELDARFYCLGYLTGFDDGTSITSATEQQAMAASALDSAAGVAIAIQSYRRINGCNDGVTVGQVMLVFLKYVDNHPEELHLPAAVVVSRAMLAAFPCRQ